MPFKDYKGTPLRPFLLPIIPVDAPLSPTSRLKPERLGKIPGHPTDKGWVGYEDFTKQVNKTDKILDAYDRMFEGTKWQPIVGILSEEWPAIDSDIDGHPKLNEILWETIKMFAGETLVRTRENSGRLLFMFKLKPGSPPWPKKTLNFYLPGQPKFKEDGTPAKPTQIEFLAKGQQYLIEGMHKSGVPYEWIGGLCPHNCHDLICAIDKDEWYVLFEMVRGALIGYGCDFDIPRPSGQQGSGTSTAEAEQIGPEHFDVCPDLSLLEELLKAFPATHAELQDRDAWVTFLRAVKAACGGDDEFYANVVEPWNMEFPGITEDDIRGRWESFHDSSFGWSYLLNIALADSPAVIARLFDDAADFSALSAEDTAPPKPASQRLGSDEGSLADQFVKENARTRWMVVRQDDKAHFYRCDEGIWELDNISILHEVSAMCRKLAAWIRQQQYRTAQDRKAAISRANALSGEGVARRVVNLVKANPAMHVMLGELDAHDWLVGFKGGYVDRDNNIHAPDPSLLLTKCLAYKPDFGAKCPEFMAHIQYLAKDDPDEVEALLRWKGYCLSGTGQEQKFVFLRGAGGSGVTTLIEIVAGAYGTYSRAISHKAFMVGTSERFGPATLARGWYLFSNEIDKQGQWSDTTLKAATGSGRMEIEEKNRDPREIRPRGGITFQGNTVPTFGHLDNAIRRRMVLAEYDQKRGADGLLDVKDFARDLLKREGPAIVACLLKARQRYDSEGLLVPKRWQRSTEEYFASIDTKMLWLEECGYFDRDAEISTQEAYKNFNEWHDDAGYRVQVGSIHAFVRALKEHPIFRKQGVIHKRERVNGKLVSKFIGFGLNSITSSTDLPKF